MSGKSQKKVLIIGSGIGGLSCAIILLKLGYNVTVIEKNSEPGGLMRSYRRSGIDCPVGVHYIGSYDKDQLLRRIFDYLGVSSMLPMERMGTEGLIDRYIFDGFTFDLPPGTDALEESLHKKLPADAKQISSIMKSLRTVEDSMRSFDFIFSGGNIISMPEFLKPLGQALSELNCSPELYRILEVPCFWTGVPLDECPVFFHHNTLLSYLFSAWRLKCSGAYMADVFCSRINELGGSIITGDEVLKIITKEKTATGIKLKSGTTLESDIIIAAIHPKSMLGILQEESTKPAYIKRISQIKDTGGMFSVHLSVDASSHKELSYNIFSLKTMGKGNLSGLEFFQLRNSGKDGANILTIIAPGEYDEWRKWEGSFTGHRGNDYLDKKHGIAEKLIQSASSILGPLKDPKILDIYTPLTIRDWVNSPKGSAYGVMRSNRQFLQTASLGRTPVKGLYLAGQSALAPGIFGTAVGSLATVRSIIGTESFKNEVLDKC